MHDGRAEFVREVVGHKRALVAGRRGGGQQGRAPFVMSGKLLPADAWGQAVVERQLLELEDLARQRIGESLSANGGKKSGDCQSKTHVKRFHERSPSMRV